MLQMSLDLWDDLDLLQPPDGNFLEELCSGSFPDVDSDVKTGKADVRAPAASPLPSRACSVDGCKGLLFSRTSALRRHWIMTHLPNVKMYLCPVQGCTFRSPREDKVREHCGKCHPQAFKDDQDRRNQLLTLPAYLVANNKYQAPGAACPPPIVGDMLQPSLLPGQTSERTLAPVAATLKRKSHSENLPPGMRLKKATYSSKSSDADKPAEVLKLLDFTNRSTTSLIPAIPKLPPNSPKSGQVSVTDKSRCELSAEYYRNDHIIVELQKRNALLRKELKRRETEELTKLRLQSADFERRFKEASDQLRVKEREIRHLKASNSSHSINFA